MKKIKKRRCFAWGMLFAVFFWYCSGLFVWNISIEGNQRLSEEELLRFLRDSQIVEGMRKRNLNLEMLEKQIRENYPYISWTGTKLTGTKLMIQVKENAYFDEENHTTSEEAGTNLLSVAEGKIVSIIVRKGIPKVKKGDRVLKNQLLVEGKVPVYAEDGTIRYYQYVQADADIILEHYIEKRFTLPLILIKRYYTGRETSHNYIRWGENSWNFFKRSKYLTSDKYETQKSFQLFQRLGIPLSLGIVTEREYMDMECESSYTWAKESLNKKNSFFLQSLSEKGVQIIEKNVKIENGNNMWILYEKVKVHDVRTMSELIDQAGVEQTENE